MIDPSRFNVPTDDRVMNNEALVPHTSKVTVWCDLSLTVYLSGKISKNQIEQGKKRTRTKGWDARYQSLCTAY